jgi:hypothetical protein
MRNTYVIMANGHNCLRHPSSLATRSPNNYLEADTLICFNELGLLFNFVLSDAASTATRRQRQKWLGPDHEHLVDTFWPAPNDPPQTAALPGFETTASADPTSRLSLSQKFVAFILP